MQDSFDGEYCWNGRGWHKYHVVSHFNKKKENKKIKMGSEAAPMQVINPADLRGIVSTPQTDLFLGDPSKDTVTPKFLAFHISIKIILQF